MRAPPSAKRFSFELGELGGTPWGGIAILVRRPTRQECLVSDKFSCLAVQPSGVWVQGLVDKYSSLVLCSLRYQATWRDGTLKWSEVTGIEVQGVLWEPGLRAPLLSGALAERRRCKRLATAGLGLHSGDPLAETARPAASGRGRGGFALGRGRTRRGQAQQSEPQAPPIQQSSAAPIPNEQLRATRASAESGMASDPEIPAGQPVELAEEMDMLDLERELEGLMGDDVEELLATYLGDVLGPEAGPDHQGLLIGDVAETQVPDFLPAAVEEEAKASGLGVEMPDEDDTFGAEPEAGVGGVLGSSSDPPPPPEEEVANPPTPAALGVTGPSPMGYVSQGGRSIARIQRGSPRNSLSVKCYQHPGCTWLLPLRLAPPDSDLLAWCVEVPPATSGMSPVEAKSLARQHVQMADRWRERRPR